LTTLNGLINTNRLSYRRGTARRPKSVEILSALARLYEKSPLNGLATHVGDITTSQCTSLSVTLSSNSVTAEITGHICFPIHIIVNKSYIHEVWELQRFQTCRVAVKVIQEPKRGSFKVTANVTGLQSTYNVIKTFHRNCVYLAPFHRYRQLF